MITTLHRGGYGEMITVLHRGGYAQMITILHRGGGSLGTPKSDYVICARPLTGKTYSDRTRQRMDGGLSKVEPSLKERIFASCRLSSSKPLSPTIRNIVVIFCKNNIVRIQIKTSIHLL